MLWNWNKYIYIYTYVSQYISETQSDSSFPFLYEMSYLRTQPTIMSHRLTSIN